MTTRRNRNLATALAATGLVLGAFTTTSILRGDEPSRLSRLFRAPATTRPSNPPAVGKTETTSQFGNPLSKAAAPAPPASYVPGYGLPSSQPAQPGTSPGSSRLVAQPRNSRAATESDPVITRMSIGRADDGKQFCMFVQVFADGTVLDSEGVHKVGADSLRPIAVLIQSGELAKLKGHCGGPASDFIEQVHVVVYDRYLGRLRANAFSYSGNPQGCNPSVKELNNAIDALQAKLAGPPVAATPTATASPSPEPKPIGLTPGA